jgi:tetratricopeptide (TPR) repeat protein
MKYTTLIVCAYTLKSNDSLGAQVYITLRQFEAAVQDCNKALEINPDWTKAYFRKAMALSEMTELLGSDEQALAVLK